MAHIRPKHNAPNAPTGDPARAAAGDAIGALMMTAARAPRQLDTATLDRLSAADRAELSRRAKEHRFLPYLDFALATVAGARRLPAAQAARHNWTVRYLSICRECILIHRILSQHGIPHLFLKGIPLALASYPTAALRPVRDIDILVQPGDLARAFALLKRQGGGIDRYAQQDHAIDPAQKHCTPIWSPSRVIPVELHDKLAGEAGPLSPQAEADFTKAVWADTGTFRVGAQELPCPGPTMMFLHLVIHALYDHELNNGPLFVTDLIHLLQGPELTPGTVARLSGEFGIATGVALALSLLPPDTPQRAALCAAIDLPAALPEETAAALLLQNTRFTTETKLAATLAQASSRGRAALVLGRVFARRETMLNRWTMAGRDGAPPANRLLLWLWYLGDRATAMRRLQAAQPGGGTLHHLLALRRLRDAGRT